MPLPVVLPARVRLLRRAARLGLAAVAATVLGATAPSAQALIPVTGPITDPGPIIITDPPTTTLASFALSVHIVGQGSVGLTNQSGFIIIGGGGGPDWCTADCSRTYSQWRLASRIFNPSIKLDIQAAPGWAFTGWDPAGLESPLGLGSDRTITAFFTDLPKVSAAIAGHAAGDALRGGITLLSEASDNEGVDPPTFTLAGPGGSTDVPAGPGAGPGSFAANVDTTGLADGAYVLTATAHQAGFLARSTTSSVWNFVVDNTAPKTKITAGPSEGSRSPESTTQSWAFGADEPGVHFECRVYLATVAAPAFGPCTSAGGFTAEGLKPGAYLFEVRGTDPLGNLEAVAARRAFRVVADDELAVPSGAGGGSSAGGALAEELTDSGRVTFRYVYAFRATTAKTSFTDFYLRGLSAGAKLVVTCKGGGCPSPKKLVARYAKATALWRVPALVGRGLKAGTTITVVAARKGAVGKVVVIRTRRGKAPTTTERCLPAGKTKPVRCPK